jgi:hypothetical protein
MIKEVRPLFMTAYAVMKLHLNVSHEISSPF